MSADYDQIAEFFEDVDLYLSRLKILEEEIPPVPELKIALARVLTSVLDLCGICAKYVKMKRISMNTLSSIVRSHGNAPFSLSFRFFLGTPSKNTSPDAFQSSSSPNIMSRKSFL